MKYCYLFETKSIQSYLFRSGKLKDVIAASERLGALIDSDKSSVLAKVLESANIPSDLLNPSIADSPGMIRFLRCKGGAFYACSDSLDQLLALRSIWTLTIQQLFPSLVFIDALGSGENIPAAMEDAHRILGAERNTPDVNLPAATAISERDQRTGFISVPVSPLAKKSTHGDDTREDAIDIDIELHRQAYSSLKIKDAAALQDRFTPPSLRGQIGYPVNLETDFKFSAPNVHSENKDAIKDIALIHIDGNGLGALLIALRDALKNASDNEYRLGFRAFSEALATATESAAQEATRWLHSVASYELEDSTKPMLPMRPLVLGGDDLTLLCRADLALEYSKRFCKDFKKRSQDALKPLFKNELKKSSLAPYLTASGGILFHKAGHPFVNTHHLVEDLCQHAKKLTKDAAVEQKVGPAALSFYRMNKSTASSFEELMSMSQTFDVVHNNAKNSLKLGLNAFFVDDDDTLKPKLSDIEALATQSRKKNALVSMGKWRQMATHIALGDMSEAQRVYHRAINRADDKGAENFIPDILGKCTHQTDIEGWFWKQGSSELQCLISDLLIVDHFRPVIETKEG